MKEILFGISRLVVLHRLLLTAFLIWFLLAAIACFVGYGDYGHAASHAGILGIIAATLTRIVLVAEQFRRARLYRLWLLGYMLIILILSTAVWRYVSL